MAPRALSRLRWQAAHAAHALGPAGLGGLVLLLASAVVVSWLLRPMQAETDRQDRLSREAEHAPAVSAAPMRLGAAERLAAFEHGFVVDAQVPGSVERVLGIAARHHLRIEQAEFKLTSEAGQPLQRYAMAMPARGDYRSLRRFVLDALREQPGLALEELALRRGDPRSAALDAQIRFVLFVRKPKPAEAGAAASGDAAPSLGPARSGLPVAMR